MAAGHFLKVTDEEINYIVSKKMHINFVQGIGFSTREFNVFVDLDLLFREVEECFFPCHWAVSCNKLAKRRVT